MVKSILLNNVSHHKPKHDFMKKVISLFLFFLMVWNSSAKDFPKVILAGDYPDPSILRDGKDYYMTHSPFYYAPGFLIWHSQDLEHWEPV